MPLLRISIQGGDLLSSESHSNDLHRLRASTRTTAPPSLQLLDVVASLGLGRLLLDLLLSHTASIAMPMSHDETLR